MNKKLHFKGNRKLFSSILLIFIGLLLLNIPSQASPSNMAISQSSKTVTLNISNGTIKSILIEIQKQTKLSFVYKDEILKSLSSKSIVAKNEATESVLKRLFEGTGLTFSSNNNIITITQETIHKTGKSTAQITVNGKILNKSTKAPIVGATVTIVGKTTGAITNDDGFFSFPAMVGEEIEVSYIGTKPLIVKVTDKSNDLILLLESDALAVDDVVVTGIFTRKKESFTGSAATYTAKDLKMIGNGNILQSLKSLDPSFAIVENNLYGSDPNRLPDVEIRGKTSVIGLSNEYKTDPNQPLFILDGFESSLATISDLSMDRVQSIVVLKDAAATAIYGSKAANGVIVVETKVPEMGKLAISYNGNFKVSFADLSDYNLMNAPEKLEFERLSGYYGAINANGQFKEEILADKYYSRKAEIARGVNSYWLNEPLRTVFGHTHNLYAEGGENKLRYGVGFSYGDNKGVMKGSGRELINGNIRLIYRTKNIAISNKTELNYSLSKREKVSFSEFSSTNPFFKKRDADGEIIKVLEKYNDEDMNSPTYMKEEKIFNPMYNASLGSYDNTSMMGFTNNTDVDWFILDGLKARARFSISKSSSRQVNFKSPFHTDFDKLDKLKRGTYNRNDGSDLNYDGDFSLTYGKLFKEKHMVNLVVGSRLSDNSSLNSGYKAEGFIDDEYSNPSFATSYSEEFKKPSYSEAIKRSVSFYVNGGYSYENRYMLDVNFRTDGSSVFGSSNRFTKTWSVGLAWNINNEPFMKDVKWLDLLKIRATMGNPGNQNFDPYISLKTYTYNNTLQNPFGISTIISKLGNNNLEWQKTIDKNLGVDFGILDRKLIFNFDFYNKVTDPLLIYIDMPSSSGTSSVPRNMGSQNTKGFTAAATYFLIQKSKLSWSVNANVRHETSVYEKIGNSLESYNKENRSKNLVRYYDGASATAMWSVKSAGIDPATGREIFIKKDGTQTFVHDYNDEIVIGDSRSKVEGVFGTTFYYKGFSLSTSIRYKLGASVLMSALYDKVENISKNSLQYNQDRRALSDRWQRPGMEAKFKSISISETTPMSSRFIAKENVLTGESISIGYETDSKWFKKNLGLTSLSFKAYMTDIFRISSVRNERGIEYPFERSVSFSLGLRF